LGFDQKKNVVDREEKGRINNYKWKKADLRFLADSEVGKRNAAAHSRYWEEKKRLAHGDGKEQQRLREVEEQSRQRRNSLGLR